MHTSQKGIELARLFSYDIRYEVPLYQRRYVWDETNWRTLCEDIFAQLGLELEEGPNKEFTFKKREEHQDTPVYVEDEHFTGLIVIRPISKEGGIERIEVIDGQQRLTTFQIILCVIRDIFKLEKCADHASEAEKLIVNGSTVIERATSQLTYKFWPTEYDRKEFEFIVTGEYGELIPLAFDEETNSLREKEKSEIRSAFIGVDNHNIFDVYDYFYKLIKVYIGKDWDYKKLDNLLNTVKNRFALVQITLDKSDQSEKIFESINATGRKLLEFDYLRNNLFLRAKQLDDPGSSDRFYGKYWRFENSHSYWSADKLESFLRVFLMAKLGPYCFQSSEENEKDKKKAFEVYQKSYYKEVKDKAIKDNFTPEDTVEHEFSELSRYSEAYRKADLDNPEFVDQSDKIRFHMKFYDDLNMTSLLPFILYLQCEANQTIDQLEIVFKILESYLLRRMVNSGNGRNDKDEGAYKNIHGYFSKLIKNPKFDIKEFVQALDGWPNNDNLSTNLGENAKHISTRNNSFQFRYIFYRIEQYLNKESRLSFKDFLHYNPVRIASKEELRDVFYGQKRMADNDWQELQRYYDSPGNLTFLRTSEINSDKVIIPSFEDMRGILSKLSKANLRLNREISQASVWRRTSVVNRRKKIYRHFCDIWPEQDWFLKKISGSLPKTHVGTTPKTLEKQASKLKTCSGEIKLWRGSYGYIESSDLETRIEVNMSDFRDRTAANPVEQGQKVKFEIDQTQSGKNVKPINLVRIKE